MEPPGRSCPNLQWDAMFCHLWHTLRAVKQEQSNSTYPKLPQPLRTGTGLSGPGVKGTTQIQSAALVSGVWVLGTQAGTGLTLPAVQLPHKAQPSAPTEGSSLTGILHSQRAIPRLLACH